MNTSKRTQKVTLRLSDIEQMQLSELRAMLGAAARRDGLYRHYTPSAAIRTAIAMALAAFVRPTVSDRLQEPRRPKEPRIYFGAAGGKEASHA